VRRGPERLSVFEPELVLDLNPASGALAVAAQIANDLDIPWPTPDRAAGREFGSDLGVGPCGPLPREQPGQEGVSQLGEDHVIAWDLFVPFIAEESRERAVEV
jgi:hypothetical protein